MQDAFDKATRENCQYFFTWNVEEWALFDRSKWDAPTMHERLVAHWKLGLKLNRPTDISLAHIHTKIFSDFLPQIFNGIAAIIRGKKGDFSLANTLFFGKKPGRAHECASRAEAELLYQIATEGLRGTCFCPIGRGPGS